MGPISSSGGPCPRRLREAGSVDVRADAYFPITAPAGAVLEAATMAQIREPLVQAGLCTEGDIDEHLRNVARGELDLATAPMVSAWGRAPTPPRSARRLGWRRG